MPTMYPVPKEIDAYQLLKALREWRTAVKESVALAGDRGKYAAEIAACCAVLRVVYGREPTWAEAEEFGLL